MHPAAETTPSSAPDLMPTGRVRPSPSSILWVGGMTLAALIAGPRTATPGALALFATSTALTLCCGHSVGLHRLLIHRALETHRWLERLLVYLGTLVGLGGPIGMMHLHNLRDEMQSGPACPDYFAARAGLVRDYFEQLYGRFDLDVPYLPRTQPAVTGDRFYRFLEATWRLQQLPWALLFYAWGGWGFVVWGICARVAVGVTGHWLVGHIVHNRGYRNFAVEGVSLQGWNSRLLGALAMGEGWHNNHHAFPHSARLGLLPGEVDPGWIFLCALRRLGLVWDIQLPESQPPRHPVHALQ